MSFSALKKSRSSSFDKLNAQLQKLNNTGGNKGDDRFWKPEVDKAGNGFAFPVDGDRNLRAGASAHSAHGLVDIDLVDILAVHGDYLVAAADT